VAGHRIVVALVDGREDIGVRGHVGVDFLDVRGGEVGEAELGMG